ncbi:dipeptidase PepE [Flavobacteriaceae bacterium Ap0902]|nr:dipeptidase PepE [Flavobacteriaceae bacterium Ap0902]
MRNFILASTSTVYGSSFLEYLTDELKELFKDTEEILFIPYARPSGLSHDNYTQKVQEFFSTIGKKATGLHTFKNKKEAIKNSKGIFTGGGNTFLLVKTLYDFNLFPILKNVIENGTPYLGTSAGSNIGGINMKTTNDMPIVYPPSFDTMGLIPFNINPHYLDPNPASTHKGETRETRILEFLTQNDIPVLGIREGNWIRCIGKELTLEGENSTRIFIKNKAPYEVNPHFDLNQLI